MSMKAAYLDKKEQIHLAAVKTDKTKINGLVRNSTAAGYYNVKVQIHSAAIKADEDRRWAMILNLPADVYALRMSVDLAGDELHT